MFLSSVRVSLYCRTNLAPLLWPFWGLYWMSCTSVKTALWLISSWVSPSPVWTLRIIQSTVILYFSNSGGMPMHISLPLCSTLLSSILPWQFQLPPWLCSLSLQVSKNSVVCLGLLFLCYCLKSASRQKARATSRVHLICLPSLRVHCLFCVYKHSFHIMFNFLIVLGESQILLNQSWLEAQDPLINLKIF